MNHLNHWKANILILLVIIFSCQNTWASEVGDEYLFSYTGNYQEFIAPVQGKYKLEVWGAEGGL